MFVTEDVLSGSFRLQRFLSQENMVCSMRKQIGINDRKDTDPKIELRYKKPLKMYDKAIKPLFKIMT